MRGKFPRKVTLYNRMKVTQIFSFENEKEEKDIISSGNWIENPAEWNDPDPSITDIEEEEAEIELHKPETPDEPVLLIKDFKCGECNFEGKNAQSLRMHIRHNHGVK